MNFNKEWIEQMLELQKKAQQMHPNWANQFSEMLKSLSGTWAPSNQPAAGPGEVGSWQNVWNTMDVEGEKDSGPLLTIMEGHKTVTVSGILPGVKLGQLYLKLRGNTLIVSGESTSMNTKGTSGRFSRSIKLPVEVEAQTAKAAYRNGYLEIRFRKKQQNEHTIQVEFS